MELFQKNVLRILYIAAFAVILLIGAFAADESLPLYVYPSEVTGGEIIAREDVPMLLELEEDIPDMTMSDDGIAFIVSYEGFTADPIWDYQQYSIGYGNSYETAKKLFGEDCAPITEEQGMELLRYGLIDTEAYMNSFYQKNNIRLNQNQYDALMSFTYNVGIGWTTYKNEDGTWCKLKTLLLSDPSAWTEEAVKAALGTWVNAGGVQLPGLVTRRAAEAKLFMTPWDDTAAPEVPDAPEKPDAPETPDVPEKPLPEPPYRFQDVLDTDWFFGEVMEAYDLGLVSGIGDDCFDPLGMLTRSQMVKMLANFHGVGDMDDHVQTPFADVGPGAWYAAEVAWAAENGYVLGCDDGLFHPDDPITREQMCTILARYLKAQGYTVADQATDFPDDGQISSFARVGVYFCSELGIINGNSAGWFVPQEGATRCQAAAVMLRAYKLGVSK